MSTDFAQEDSPTTQDDHTGEFVRQQGLPPWTRTYYDLGESAGSTERRPGILQLIADAEKLRPAAVVFYKLDRAFRNNYEQGTALRMLKKAGVKVLKVRDPNITGPQGEMVDGILGVVNQFERQITGVRIRDHNLTMARQGLWPGGRPPYGYRYVPAVREQHGRKKVTITNGYLEQHPDEWPVCRRLWEWALDGYRLTEIATMANGAGYRRRNGSLWTYEEIARILANRTYAGYIPYSSEPRTGARSVRHWDNTDWYPGQHEPMVTMEQWLRVQAMLARPAGRRRQPNKRARAELAGLIRCRICGGPVTSVGCDTKDGYYYGCQASVKGGGGHKSWIRSPWLLHEALKAVLDRAAGISGALPPVEARSAAEGEREAVQREITRLEQQRKRLRQLFKLGEYNDDLDEYQRDARAIDIQIAAAEARLAEAGPTGEVRQALRLQLQRWDDVYSNCTTVPEKQRFWENLVEGVRMDQTSMRVTLRDLDPAVPREWEVQLPPPKARRPGSKCGRGIAGQRGGGTVASKSWFEQQGLDPQPVLAKT